MKKGNFYYNKKGQILDEHMQIIAHIREHEQKGERIWFSKIVEILKDKFTRSQISKAQDRLYDCGVLDMKYEKVADRWTCCWKLESEAEYLADVILGKKE